jgi:hypothetical protein
MSSSRIRRLVVVAVGAVTLGLAIATPAYASAGQPSTARATAADVANFGCGSAPRFVSSNDGTFTGNGINIRSGPYTGCRSYGLGYRGNALKVWCYVINNNGYFWVYLNDRSTGVRGWSAAQYVTWSGSIPYCT